MTNLILTNDITFCSSHLFGEIRVLCETFHMLDMLCVALQVQVSFMFNWLVVWNIFYFPIYWEFHHPN